MFYHVPTDTKGVRMIPDAAILEKVEELIAVAGEYGARNLRFFGDVVSERPSPNCGVDMLVDLEGVRDAQADIQALETRFSEVLGRTVNVKTLAMFIPPILDLILDEAVHADVFLHRNADHLRGTPIDADIIEHRLELLVLATRYGAENVRLIGDIARPSHRPDCSVQMLVDRNNQRFDQRELPYLELRMGSILGRVVHVYTPDMILPPQLQHELQSAIQL